MDQYSNLINGEWVAAQQTARNINPSDVSDTIGAYAQADAADVDTVVQAALAAFPAWATGGVQKRSESLERIGVELLARREELGDLLAREEGKTLPEAIGEVTRAGQIFKFFAGECLRLTGETLPSVRPGIGIDITREPIGVVGLITPWNFPIAISVWKIAPALAYGNCVVLKPAELVPGSAWALAEIIHRAGIPAGVFNLVMGRGSVIGEALVQHPGVAAISFTGSTDVGQRIAEGCVREHKKVQLEMGGKNPQIVLDDADLAQAVELCAQSAFYSTGQRCTASSRLIVTRGIHDRFVTALTARMARIRVGDARAAGTDIGPAASEAGYAFQPFAGGALFKTLVVEPHAQVIYDHYRVADAVVSDLRLRNGASGNWQSRIGARLHPDAANAVIRPFLEANWLYTSANPVVRMGDTSPRFLSARNAFELKAGAQARVGTAWRLSAQVFEQSGNGSPRSYGGSVNVSYRW